MPREVKLHRVDKFNEEIQIWADEPGPGGASHEYRVTWKDRLGHLNSCDIKFQEGGVKELIKGVENGYNGLSNEVLLAIVADRLEGFQSGQFPHTSNANALADIKSALDQLRMRSQEREARGVEGKAEA